jgi:hypothetical protein
MYILSDGSKSICKRSYTSEVIYAFVLNVIALELIL